MLTILVTLIVGFLGLAQDQWVGFSDSDGVFSILIPEKMQIKEQLVNTQTGDYLVKTFYLPSAVDSTENFLYMLTYYRVDQELYSVDSSEINFEFLQQSVKDLALNLGADIMYTSPQSAELYSAIDFRMTYDENKLALKGKMVLNPSYFFTLQVHSTKQYALNTNMDLFLNSFRILDN